MTEIVQLRYIEEEDIDKIVKLENEAHKTNGEIDVRSMSKSDFIDFVGGARTRIVVLTVNKEVNGFLLFDGGFHDKIAKVSRLISHNNNEDYLKELLKSAEELTPKANRSELLIEIYEDDDVKIKILKEAGYKAKMVRNKMVDGQKFDQLEFTKKIKNG